MYSQYNRQGQKVYPLNNRGARQAMRNDSHQIWTLISWQEQNDQSFLCRSKNKQLQQTLDQTRAGLTIDDNSIKKKSVSFSYSQNEQKARQNNLNVQQNKSKQEKFERKSKIFIKSKNSSIKQNKEKQKNIEINQLGIQKRKSLQKYIKNLKPYTRTLSNSAFKKLYQRPCPQTYGSRNTNQPTSFYGNFMKTHNIQPHTLDNKPQNYQTFLSALNYGKRTKLDQQDRWIRLQRQYAKNINIDKQLIQKYDGEIKINQTNKDELLKKDKTLLGEQIGQKYQNKSLSKKNKKSKSLSKISTKQFEDVQQDMNIQRKQLSRSLSGKPLCFIYKYTQPLVDNKQQNCTRLAQDRHGITCYVDTGFNQNDKAYVNFLKTIKPIYPQKCKKDDMNIDKIRVQNFEKSKNIDSYSHYLIPVVQAPYDPRKYSINKNSS